MTVDTRTLADLATFARIEIESRDVEPWALTLRSLYDQGTVDQEGAHWLVKAYNAFDDLSSGWGFVQRWPSPDAWRTAADRASVIDFPCTQERRGLRGGRVAKHYDSYLESLAGQTQVQWFRTGYLGRDPADDFVYVLAHVRAIWGVGRQTAFEWAEFVEKVLDVPILAADAQLWESEGPRRSLQKMYGNPAPTLNWLNDRAAECRQMLADEGVALSWEDFETIICDFNVMRDGRYYPGRHLAALREEIDAIPAADRGPLDAAWAAVVPDAWAGIRPGIDKALCKVYRDTGKILDAAQVVGC